MFTGWETKINEVKSGIKKFSVNVKDKIRNNNTPFIPCSNIFTRWYEKGSSLPNQKFNAKENVKTGLEGLEKNIFEKFFISLTLSFFTITFSSSK